MELTLAEAVGKMAASLVALGLLLGAGRVVLGRMRVLRALFLPVAVVSGVLGLLLGPQGLGAAAGAALGAGHPLAGGLFPAWVPESWAALPKLLITVVFAGLLLGGPIPPAREVWRKSGPQILHGYTLAFGQYALAFLVVVLVLSPYFGVDPTAGALIEIAFTGGHGTAAGMAPSFELAGFPEGRDLALGLATVGIIAGVVLGTLYINIAVRTGCVPVACLEPDTAGEADIPEPAAAADSEAAGEADADGGADVLTIQLALLALAVAAGWLLKEGLVLLEARTWGAWTETPLMPLVPLFPLAMIGGVAVQLALSRLGLDHLVHRGLLHRVTGAALDFLIAAALATMSLRVIGGHWEAFAVLSLTGLCWSIFAFWVLAPRMIPGRWFERALADMGQSTGVVATGLLLLRVSDPRNRTGALEAFGCKQLLFEPFVGGGLVTALSVPLTVQFGPRIMLLATAALTLAALCGGLWLARGIRRAAGNERNTP
ncbi:MAG: sodium:glutamate symporter [Candidatus Hydrogenedentes bacterium]|nr:sodium:glutamate symporter [Candidatus Hydrogenedentota bacterium]